MSFSIRLARVDDAESFALVEADAATLLHEYPGLAGIPVPPAETAGHYRSVIAKGHCLTAVEKDETAGFAAAGRVRRELHLHELSVRRQSQRRTIGGTLLRALMIDARNCGLQAVTLNTFRDIPWNAPFYARHGFVEVENFEGREHLSQSLEAAVAIGIPRESRIAMIAFLD